jgi:UDP-3-O-[3-hydroxymyristoyl] glucosamine N-acyltransferase
MVKPEVAIVLSVTDDKRLPTCSLAYPKNDHVTFARNQKAIRSLRRAVSRMYVLVWAGYKKGALPRFCVPIPVAEPEWVFAVYHNWVHEQANNPVKKNEEGEGCVIDETAVIGAVGLKIVESALTKERVWVHHVGNVVMGKNVYVGPQSTIHRAVMDSTIIKDDVVIGSFCNIGHNAYIDERAILTVGVAVGGSAVIGRESFIGMNATIRDGVYIDEYTLLGAGSVATKNLGREVVAMSWDRNRNAVHPSFRHGKNLSMGVYNVIEADVKVGDNVKIENHVYLKKGTRIGNNVVVDSYVRSGGNDRIGDGSILKIRTTISPDTFLGERVFMGPHSMVLHATPDGTHLPVTIKDGVFVGACALIGPGVTIEKDVIIGAMAFARKNCLQEGGVYVGMPARLVRRK